MSREPVGSVAEEAAKLFSALHDNNQGYAAGTDHDRHRSGPECQWCPLCQLFALVRQARPETVEQVGAAVTGVLGSLRDLLDAATESVRAARGEAQQQPGPGPATAERVDVSEDPEPWD